MACFPAEHRGLELIAAAVNGRPDAAIWRSPICG